MKIGTQINWEDDREMDRYSCIIYFNDQESKDSLSDYLTDECGYDAEFCSGGDEYEVFNAEKWIYDNKKEFQKEIRKHIKTWKEIHR